LFLDEVHEHKEGTLIQSKAATFEEDPSFDE